MAEDGCVIKPIDKVSVHKICSGQVILTLATAVKELVENSLDAEATNIEIRLKDHGATLVEVSDNGCGIKSENLSSLGLKHHTSKLRDFTDLIGIETFGFRGEALSSLCALSNVSVVTRHSSSEVATKIEFDHNGAYLNRTSCARQIGTTVTLKDLFKPLPVRHKEFTKNSKKEFHKMYKILCGYGLVSHGIKINCTNVNNGKKTMILSTNGNSTVEGNITNIFGSQQMKNVVKFKQVNPDEQALADFDLNDLSDALNIFKINGLVSVCQHDAGRSTTDRQFFFINKRPCDPSKISKVINEVYHQYNRHQYPFVYLDISFDKDSVDVNVTKDKRQIFVQNEKWLLATIKTSLNNMYSSTAGRLDVSSTLLLSSGGRLVSNSIPSNTMPETPRQSQLSLNRLKRAFSHNNENSPMSERNAKQSKINFGRTFRVNFDNHDTRSDSKKHDSVFEFKPNGFNLDDSRSNENVPVCTIYSSTSPVRESANSVSLDLQDNRDVFAKHCKSNWKVDDQSITEKIIDRFPDQESCDRLNDESNNIKTTIDTDEVIDRKTITIPFNISKITPICKQKGIASGESDDWIESSAFRAKIAPEDNKKAENELSKTLTKPMLEKMDVICQFNLGFIIARLGSDLFIIDQHATDEKYNYEMLQKDTVLQTQKLIRPLELNLTAVNESILIDNLEIFRKNGFDFEAVDETYKLVSIPVCKNWTFGKEDIEELIFMLSDSPGVMCRPSRVQQMFASQSCRKSIMIGTCLNRAQMQKLVRHMGEIEQPWNCPHGRPTIRHLINLDSVHRSS